MPFERRVFQVTATVTLVRPEDDRDLHIVLRAGRKSMIAESLQRRCSTRVIPGWRWAVGNGAEGPPSTTFAMFY